MKNEPVSVNLSPELLTDQNLYNLCKTYGERALVWRQKFAGLLPEVFKRKLYEKKGFYSIFEFAKKLSGMSERQVRLVLNLEKRFEKIPILKSLLTNGEVSVNKLARVVSIADLDNQEVLAKNLKMLSQGAIETLVRDQKVSNSENQNGLFQANFDTKSLRAQTFTLQLAFEVEEKLLELQRKGIDINNLLLEFLQKREQDIEDRKQEIANAIIEKEKQKLPTRYIPRSVKVILQQEHGEKCSIENCQKKAETIHHTRRFSISASHNPYYLAPLCKGHHELAHATDAIYHQIRGRHRSAD